MYVPCGKILICLSFKYLGYRQETKQLRAPSVINKRVNHGPQLAFLSRTHTKGSWETEQPTSISKFSRVEVEAHFSANCL